MRFPRSQRLSRAAQFESIRKAGRRFDTGPFLVWFWQRPTEPAVQTDAKLRFAINASRRVGCAVVRNRLKRVMREAFRLHHNELPAGCDVWIQLKSDVTAMASSELARRLVEAGRRFTKQGNREAVTQTPAPPLP
jgi:ribonuclease P protein component